MAQVHLNRKGVFEELKKLPNLAYSHYSPTSMKAWPAIWLVFRGYKNIRYSIAVCFTLTRKELDEQNLFEQCYLHLAYTHPVTLIETEYDLPIEKTSTIEDYQECRHKETSCPGSGYLPEFKSDGEFIERIKQLIDDINNHPWDKETFAKYGLHIQG